MNECPRVEPYGLYEACAASGRGVVSLRRRPYSPHTRADAMGVTLGSTPDPVSPPTGSKRHCRRHLPSPPSQPRTSSASLHGHLQDHANWTVQRMDWQRLARGLDGMSDGVTAVQASQRVPGAQAASRDFSAAGRSRMRTGHEVMVRQMHACNHAVSTLRHS